MSYAISYTPAASDWFNLSLQYVPSRGCVVLMCADGETYITSFDSARELQGHIDEGATHFMFLDDRGNYGD